VKVIKTAEEDMQEIINENGITKTNRKETNEDKFKLFSSFQQNRMHL
jgi:hypothetical protein